MLMYHALQFVPMFPLTFFYNGECPNFFKKKIVPLAVKICLCALNFASIHYLSLLKVIFPQIFSISIKLC